jgi:hypothetical protein
MEIIGGLDVHRNQITFDYVRMDTGEAQTGRICPATREQLRGWLSRFEGEEAAFALEATTGWRFVVEELERAGCEAHLAEPADTRALRGPKKRAKTDRLDARHLSQGAAPSRAASRVVDTSGPYPGPAYPGEDAQDAGGRADFLPPAHPRPALPPRIPPGAELARQGEAGTLGAPRGPRGATRRGPQDHRPCSLG